MAIGRVNTGGGGSGGTLTVTGVAGHTVTATKDGKTYTRTFNSSGVAVFKGLSTGTWTLTMTGDGQTATRTVDVNADYAVTITYFSATINVTYPSGSACKATHTDGTVLNAPDTSGTWTCVVPKSGTWTILAEDTSAGKSKSVDVSITAEGQSESVVLNYRYYWVKNGQIQNGIGKVQEPGTDNWIKFNSSWNYFIFDTGAGSTWMRSGSKVNVTNYSKLVIEVNTVTGNSYFGLTSGDNIASSYAARKTVSSTTTSLDISSISGAYYIGLWFEYNSRNVYNIYFE